LVIESRPSALVVAPESPYPIAGGGALRTASILHYLAQRYDIHLIVFRQPGAADPGAQLPPGLIKRVSVLELPTNRRSLAARALRNAARAARGVPPLIDRFSGFRSQIEREIAGQRYAIGIVEHFWCAPYYEQVAAACARTVLNLHNVESVLHHRCAETEARAAGLAHRLFREAALELERQWLPRFSTVLATSPQDAAATRSIAPSARVSIYPNAVPRVPLPRTSADDAIVFSGNMEYHPNRSAVRYFCRDVWPVVRERHPSVVWRLAGKNPEAVRDLISGDPRIEVTGAMSDAVAELARSRVAVVPLLAGSGTRLKILEAWSAGLPVVSTPLGAEGLPINDGEHLLLAENSADFADSVSRLLDCPSLRERLGAAGRLLLEKEFTWDTVWKSLDL
jgi:glycosyltransferase involved in cell wall biosynthesis